MSRVGYWSTVKFCIRGHEFTKENTRWRTSKGVPSRVCKQCARDYMRDYMYMRYHYPNRKSQ